jgi:hypothetical protein
MIDADEVKRLVARDAASSDEINRRDLNPAFGSPSILASTTTLSVYPTSAQSYFACTPLTLLGTENEGSSGVTTPGYAPFFALNIGSTIPPSGTQVLTTFVGSRWVFRYDA